MAYKAKVIEKGDAKKVLDRIKNQFASGDVRILIGLPEDATPYPDGTSVVMVGAIHEFGSGDNPERSFLRSTINEKRDQIQDDLTKVAEKVVDGETSLTSGSRKVGLKYSQLVAKKIVDIKTPPNTLQTIRRKGSSNPLVDTGHLKSQVTFEVREGSE
jgi:hypothetical protein